MNHAQCIDVIAHALVSQGGPRDDLWEDHPEIGEFDWQAVVERADQIRDSLAPDMPTYHAAYRALADTSQNEEE